MAVQIQIRRGTAAAWTSANPTLAAGEFAVETDTDKYKFGDGSTAWTSLGYSSLPSTALSNTVVDAKGDIMAATADNTVAKLTVGSNGQVLTAASGQTTGLQWATMTHTAITVADTTDTTCFVGLFESATGDLGPKTDAGVTYNAGTGMLTATGFTGPLTGNASGSSGSTTGNAATATALATARTIAGVSFDGTANIDLPGVNAAGNQNTSGTAATVTGAAQSAITSIGTMTGLTVDGTSQLYESVTEAITGNKTPALGDAGKVFHCSQVGGTQTITIDGSISWPVGTQMVFVASNTSTVTFAESNSTSLDSKDDNKSIDGRYASAALINYGSNTWFLIGALA